LSNGDDLRLALSVGLASFQLDASGALALAGPLELGDKRSLLELRHSSQHLADQHCGRRVVEEGVRRVGGDKIDAKRLQIAPACLLHDEVTGEAVQAPSEWRLSQKGG
jgi:hypothetical protein